MAHITFGPGSLEELHLHIWKARGTGGKRIKGRLTGRYMVAADIDYTPVRIDEHLDEWVSDRTPAGSVGALAAAAVNGDRDAAHDLAHELVHWALEDWARDAA